MKAVLDSTLGDAWARDLRHRLERGQWQPVQKFLEATRQWDQREFYVCVEPTASCGRGRRGEPRRRTRWKRRRGRSS